MSFRFVVAEKPSVAQTIAAVIGAKKRCDGYWEGNAFPSQYPSQRFFAPMTAAIV